MVEAVVTVAVALLFTFAGFEMAADLVASSATVQAASSAQHAA
jgi:hypothetical protein